MYYCFSSHSSQQFTRKVKIVVVFLQMGKTEAQGKKQLAQDHSMSPWQDLDF